MVVPFTLLETHDSEMSSKASKYLRAFIILVASSIGFDFTPWPKDNKKPLAYPGGSIANSSDV
jgi:hypothetical protein